MAWVDLQTWFADELSVTVEAVTNTIDLGARPTSRSLALQNQFLVIDIPATMTDDAIDPATHVTFSLESDSTANLATSPTVHWKSAPIALASLTGGTNITVLPLPVKANYERHLGVRILPSGGSPGLLASGSVTAYLTPDPSLRTIYPDSV